MTPKLDHVPGVIWNIPGITWDMVNLGHGSSQIEILIWDVRNRTSDLGYPRYHLGHGRVWATTVPFTKLFFFQLSSFPNTVNSRYTEVTV